MRFLAFDFALYLRTCSSSTQGLQHNLSAACYPHTPRSVPHVLCTIARTRTLPDQYCTRSTALARRCRTRTEPSTRPV
eukprot:2852848-Rhodomonas_salina.1